MKLSKYRSKRNLQSSKEPLPEIKKTANELQFCVQKHAAKRLHYDFRLEFRGVLISWAVPKGPSMDPFQKHLAIQVEDHPLDYRMFEGTIPKGNYGAGTVMLWDFGTFSIPEAHSKAESEKKIAEGLKKGHFNFILHGTKLKGEFVLIRIKENDWFIKKVKDSFSTDFDITTQDYSAQTLRNMQEIGEGISKKIDSQPKKIFPMLATLINAPFDSEEWVFEVKWDGFRAIAFLSNHTVELKSRSNKTFGKIFAPIIEALKKISDSIILDGEIVVLDEKGKSNFQLMQNYQKMKKGNLVFYVFDLLYFNGMDLRNHPLLERKKKLKSIIEELNSEKIRFGEHIETQGIAFFDAAKKNNLEGIIGKKKDSSYQERRSRDWVKIKVIKRQEVVIGGFTEPRASRKHFGALLVGVYENENLIYVGHVGGGFDTKLLQKIHEKLNKIVQKKCPFKDVPQTNMPATWVKPLLVCEVAFAEWTKDNIMRQPIFQGLRSDKKANEITKEVAIPQEEVKEANLIQIPKVKGKFSNLEKILWPEDNISKGEMISYYFRISKFILPHLKNRPLVLHRFPNGINSPSFYQKEIGEKVPTWVKTVKIQHEEEIVNYVIAQDLSNLLYVANLGAIEFHPFLARIKDLEKPDFCVIDLDPEDISFQHVQDVALHLHELLEKIEIAHYCKTSGSTGLHIYIPLKAQYTFEQSRQFAELVSYTLHKKLSKITSLQRSPAKRQKKVYLDCLQNRKGQSVAAPYSLRPLPHAPVSTPLTWDELEKDLNPMDFNIMTIEDRLKKVGDLFLPVLKEKNDLKKSLSLLKDLL